MAHQFSTSYLEDSISLFRHYKKLAERAMEQCPDEGLFATLDEESNSIAIVLKHVAGNARSRWRAAENARGVVGDVGYSMRCRAAKNGGVRCA